MEVKPTVHVPEDVHLTYDGLHDYIKHEEPEMLRSPPSMLTPIQEEEECTCISPNPDCKSCQKEAFDYIKYLQRMNNNTRAQLREMTDAYNSLRSKIPDSLMTYYNDGFNHGMIMTTATITVFSVGAHFILKYFNR